jgi:CubicO group peptidase (beta-lactamase class C family)
MYPARILAACSLLVSGISLAAAADAPSAPLPRSTPEEQGVSSAALLGFVEAAEQKVDALNSFMVVRHGRVVAEGWWAPYAADEPHVLYSLSKSFNSTAVGLAISEGKLSLDDQVLKFFPGEGPAEPSKNLSAMRVRDLLRMSSGQTEDAIRSFDSLAKEDRVQAFLAIPVAYKPGTHFVYNSPGSYMLSAIVQKVTGQTVLEYLRPRLFEPLGIKDPTWDLNAQGVAFGAHGLNIRTEDIARFGELYLHHGNWHGKQLVPASWVAAATSLETSNGSDPASDWDQGYGYQFWRCKHGFFRGDGAFGQLCIVMPEYDAVVAVTAGTGDMQGEMNTVWDKILPAFSHTALPADPEGDRKLSEKLASLSMPLAAGQATSQIAGSVAGKRFVFPSNPKGVESVVFTPGKDGANDRVTLRISGADEVMECGRGAWVKGTAHEALCVEPLVRAEFPAISVSGAWSSADTYTAVVCHYRTPYTTTERLKFSGDTVELWAQNNVGFGGNPEVRLVGTAQP